MLSIRKLFLILNLLRCCLAGPCVFGQQASSAPHPAKPTSELGRSTFNSSCAACHGLDGRGSDKGVDISGSAKVRHLTDVQLTRLISEGIPGTGMPAFRTLSASQLQALVEYLRSLQGKFAAPAVSGDVKHGKEIFFGKGACSTCHTVSGEGGFMGPDLSGYGSTASATTIRDEITRTKRTPQQGYRPAVITTASGARFEGLIRNEDNFSLQFQSKDGNFHLFRKSELHGIDRQDTSVMPLDYGDRLSAAELNDLVAYLTSAAANMSHTTTSRKKEDDYE